MIMEFNENKSSSVKSIAVKSETNIKCTSRFMSGKLLMFAKLSLKDFIYSLVELFCYQFLTDKDSISLQFIFLSNLASSHPECNVRDILFEVFSKTERDLINLMNFGGALMFKLPKNQLFK